MYESHFGLLRRPFGETVNPSAYVSRPKPRRHPAPPSLCTRARPRAGRSLWPTRLGQNSARSPTGKRVAGRPPST